MKCPKCDGEKITAMGSMLLGRDFTTYDMECLDCGRKWREKRGWRRRLTAGNDRWANVEMRENSFQKERREQREKIDRGECPRCGETLWSKELEGSRGNNVHYEMTCESEACFMRVEGTMSRERWEKETRLVEDDE